MIRSRSCNDTIEEEVYSKRQDLILCFIKTVKLASREEIKKYLFREGIKSTKITILRDLDLLISDGSIQKSGRAKATRYSLSTRSKILTEIDVEEYFRKSQDERIPISIGFNFDIFSDLYDLLTMKEKAKLDSINEIYRKEKSELSNTLLQKEYERITVEFSWKSSQLEGNTYTLLDTERLLKENIVAKGKTEEETQMILNHKRALDFILQSPEYYKNLTVAKIEEIHGLVVDKLGITHGIRHNSVGIIGTNYRPLDNIYQIKDALHNLAEVVNSTEHPIEKALIAVLMISYIQPFEDGNKRTSRILGNALLLANNYRPLSYRSVDEIEYKKGVILFYEINNISYFKELFIEQFCGSG